MAGGVGTGTRYASFLLRLWCTDQPEAAQPAPGWQGEAEHIQARQRWTFDTLEELLRWLQDQLDDVPPGPGD
jgi:hypothetical protein